MLGVVALVGSLLIASTPIASEVLTCHPMLSATRHTAEAQRHYSSILCDAETVSALGMRETMRSLWNGHREAALSSHAVATAQTGALLALTKFVRMGVQIAIMGVAADLVIGGAMQAGGIFTASLMIGRALAPVE
jgi:ABC-type protease/lipase transport system fused ATPase/permease subunit